MDLNKNMHSIEEASELIRQGHNLLLAGDEELLTQLPKGNWIGGTIPYFVSEKGGEQTRTEIFIHGLPEVLRNPRIIQYDEKNIKHLAKDYPENGVSFIIIPGLSEVHQYYGQHVTEFQNIFKRPLIGWISGVLLDDIGIHTPKVFDGHTGDCITDSAVIMHMDLPDNKYGQIDILNVYEQGQGDTFCFTEGGFGAKDCLINGKKQNLAAFMIEKKIGTNSPLVGNYLGSSVNVSFQAVDETNGNVSFYASVFPGVEYRIAAPVESYEAEFVDKIDKSIKPTFSCNCVLNYVLAGLEGKKTGEITGPMTFGEIAYMLLNQTMVYFMIKDR